MLLSYVLALQGSYVGLHLARQVRPAGLELGAITPEETALFILAEIVRIRRKGRRLGVCYRTRRIARLVARSGNNLDHPARPRLVGRRRSAFEPL